MGSPGLCDGRSGGSFFEDARELFLCVVLAYNTLSSTYSCTTMVCNDCGTNTCAFTTGGGAACDDPGVNPNIMRFGNGEYNGVTFTNLPTNMQTLVGADLIGALRNENTPNVVPLQGMTAADITLWNGGADIPGPPIVPWYTAVDGTVTAELTGLLHIYKNKPAERSGILQHLEDLSIAGGTAPVRLACDTTCKACKDFTDRSEKSNTKIATTPESYANSKHPISRLYHLATKINTCSKKSIANLGLTSGELDKTTGRPKLLFENLADVKDPHTLHKVWDDFSGSIYSLGKNGSKQAWSPFWRSLNLMMDAKRDSQYCHDLAFSILNYLDSQKMPIWTFMTSNYVEHLMLFDAGYGENAAASESDPTQAPNDKTDEGITVTKREHVKFGPVTQQGYSGEMRTRNGAIAFCNKWNQREDCNCGVFAGRNKGKCAYTHKCRWCMSTQHRSEDKHPAGHANADAFICPKHR